MHSLTQKRPFIIGHIFFEHRASCNRVVQRSRLLSGWLAIGCGTLASVVTVLLPVRVLSAEPTPVPTVQSPTFKPETPVAPVPATKQILGQWLTKEPLEGDTVMFVFAPDGKAFLITGTSASGNAIASQLHYRLDTKPQPMHLDIVLTGDATVETLLGFTADGDLRLQMLGTRPGKSRPVAFTDNATLFQKISDDTTPPPGTEIMSPR